VAAVAALSAGIRDFTEFLRSFLTRSADGTLTIAPRRTYSHRREIESKNA